MQLFNKKTKVQNFWDWFIKNEAEMHLALNNEPIFDRLSQKLSNYQDGLVYELSRVTSGKREFIISADG